MKKNSSLLKNLYTYNSVLRLILLILVIAIFINFLNKPGMDWIMYMKASTLYRTSSPLYNVWIKQYGDDAVFYLYSPFFLFALLPLTYLPMQLTLVLWCVLKLIMLYRVFIIVANMLNYFTLSDRKKATILLVSFLFVLRFLLYDFDLGNITVFLLWSMMEGWHQVKRNNEITGTLLLAAGLFIKTFSIIFLPYLIYKRRFKTVLFFLMWTFILAALPFVFGRWDYNLSLYHEWMGVINPVKVSMNVAANKSSLSALHDLHIAIPAWYTAISSPLHSFLNFNDLTGNQIVIIVYTIVSIFITAFLFIPGSKLLSKSNNDRLELSELCYIIGIIPIIFPMQQKHAFIFMTPLIIYTVHYLVTNKIKAYQLLLFIISFSLMVISTDGIIGRRLNIITQQLKFITIGGIILIVLFFLIKHEEKKPLIRSFPNRAT